jgi:cholesterol oxidase
MLSIPWDQRKASYEFVVIGSGYGGAIAAARIAAAAGGPHQLCILERGSEWQPGAFPDGVAGVLQNTRGDTNPLGLYEFLNYKDISVIKGSGLGGTSLINANVAIVPDEEVFGLAGWPRTLHYQELLPYYERARQVFAAEPVPDAASLRKVQALGKRAAELGTTAKPLDLAVNFRYDGPNAHGVVQRPCVKCGDCVTGCNFSAKNTLYMNYLPLAVRAGADVFTQTKVEWLEKLAQGGWRIHGKYVASAIGSSGFTLDARNVILAAGSINSTEILLRSEAHGLAVSPALGTGFSGNGDFFGLAFNGAGETDVLGYGQRTPAAADAAAPGPSIVAAIRYNGSSPIERRIAVEDFSFPSAYIAAAKLAFSAIGGDATRVGDEDERRRRLLADLDLPQLYARDGALNHSMLYLVMGIDNARGTMNFDAPWFEPDGRMTIEWDAAGQQIVFTRMNEELRRHARALGANFISNPTWSVFKTGHLITAHPLGGCPMGEDYLHGAVDEFGRVFSGDGNIHDGLLVADGSLIPSALGVNPFLTISAVAERIAERKIRDMQGDPYPQPARAVSAAGIDPLDAIEWSEASLERVFRRTVTLPIERIVNHGSAAQPDAASHTIHNDAYWKGFFPKRHILNTLSAALFTGFKKTFEKRDGKYVGLTSDTDGRIAAHNSLEEVTIGRQTGTLDPGRYILLRYLDAQWAGFYDVLKVINDGLIVGRVYLGEYPNGARLFTFSMTRKYGFAQMTAADHDALFAAGTVPTKETLDGVWRMDIVSNNNQLGSAAYLEFDLLPDGRLASRYQLMGLFEGLVLPGFTQDHFQLNDFTPFHDEIRQVDSGFMVGRYIAGGIPDLSSLANGADLGLLHLRPGSGGFGFYYTLTRAAEKMLPTSAVLRPFLDVQLPDGAGLTFDERMTGWYFAGASTAGSGRDADLAIGSLVPAAGRPVDAVPCSFEVTIAVRDVNEFVDGLAHEAAIKGSIRFGTFLGTDGAVYAIDEQASSFQYLVVNAATGEAEMRYRLVFGTGPSGTYLLEGTKHMGRAGAGGVNAIQELLRNYTTLYCRVFQLGDGGARSGAGVACLRFRTFEDLAAVGNLAGFLGSFTVTGTNDPRLQLQVRMRFIAFTAQFVQREYDPLSPDIGRLAMDVRAEVRRGADTPDYFSTRPSTDLYAILRDAASLPIAKLVNTGAVALDLPNHRIGRDIFWKGSFARDTAIGWEERVRQAGASGAAVAGGAAFAPGAFWKRFDRVENGLVTGRVVNYDIDALPGDPLVRETVYPDDNRRYVRKGDRVLLLTYRNDPYKMVYDLIKIIGENNAIGVMHLGDFPNGIEFSPFAMARYSYPLERMSIDDHRMICARPDVVAPSAAQLQGEWDGHLILLDHPSTALLATPPTALFHLSAAADARFRVGFDGDGAVTWSDPLDPVANDLRRLDADTLLGRWTAAALPGTLLGRLRAYVEPDGGQLIFYYVLRRASA